MKIAMIIGLLSGFVALPALACKSDKDCKGDRICVDGQCQAPSGDEPPPPPKEEIIRTAKGDHLFDLADELATQLGMPADRKATVLAKLAQSLKKEKLAQRNADDPVRCMVAYRYGEGGFIVKKTKGAGLVKCAGEKERSFEVKSTAVGALIGGSSEWGVGLVFGLHKISDGFGGEYKGKMKGATIGKEGVSISELDKAKLGDGEKMHSLYLIGSASGATANAGGMKLTLQLD